MGSGKKKIEIKKIEKNSSRMVTFSKRKKGLFKKAQDLQSKTGATVAILLFSPAGKPYLHGNLDLLNSALNVLGSNSDHKIDLSIPINDPCLLSEQVLNNGKDDGFNGTEKLENWYWVRQNVKDFPNSCYGLENGNNFEGNSVGNSDLSELNSCYGFQGGNNFDGSSVGNWDLSEFNSCYGFEDGNNFDGSSVGNWVLSEFNSVSREGDLTYPNVGTTDDGFSGSITWKNVKRFGLSDDILNGINSGCESSKRSELLSMKSFYGGNPEFCSTSKTSQEPGHAINNFEYEWG